MTVSKKEPQTPPDQLDTLIEGSARALITIAPQLTTKPEIEAVIEQNHQAVQRGYFLPDEDEQIRELFSHYLTTRTALHSVLDDLRPYAIAELRRPQPRHPEILLIAFCTAVLLVRSGRFLVQEFGSQKVIWRKLDEAEPRYGIPKKQFTKVYKSLTSVRNNLIFNDAVRYYRKNESQLLALQSNPILRPITELLRERDDFVKASKSEFVKNRLSYRLHSFTRRHHSGFKKATFGLFKVSGSLIAELRMKWKRKRVTPGVQRKLSKLLKPGDVIITRHDDAASNLFLPGFWPHGALYVGTQAQRQEQDPRGGTWREKCVGENCVLEARKDGVLFRPLHDTLSVDACVVLRPRLKSEQVVEAISRAMAHQGKCYDFEFDFRRSDKLVCTEVVYRAYHGIGGIELDLKTRAGRVCLSAEDLLDYASLDKYFDVIAVYGTDGNRFATGDRALAALIASYQSAGRETGQGALST